MTLGGSTGRAGLACLAVYNNPAGLPLLLLLLLFFCTQELRAWPVR